MSAGISAGKTRLIGPWEYHHLALPPGTSRQSARTLMCVASELGGWELDRHRVWPDGRRRIVLRRRPRRVAEISRPSA